MCNNKGVSPLWIASEEGHANIVKELLQHSAEIASYNYNIEVVNVLLSCVDVDIDLCDNNGRSSLYWASHQGHVIVIKKLLHHSSKVNKCDTKVNNLLHHSAEVHKYTGKDISSLWIASQQEHVNDIKDLLLHSADINRCNGNVFSPLCIAIERGHVNAVKELLQHSIEVNKCDERGVSPLWIASQARHVLVVVELLLHSADINKFNDKDVSPLWIASDRGHVNVVKELLQHSIEVNKCDERGVSPYVDSKSGRKFTRCSRTVTTFGRPSDRGHVNVVKELLQHSIEVNKCDDEGVSPLWIASQAGHVPVVKELLQHSAAADFNKYCKDSTPPLQIASYKNRIEVVKVLLKCNDVLIDLYDNDGCTLLFLTSQQGHDDVVRELLQHSAELNKCDNKDTLPLRKAHVTAHVIPVKELLKNSTYVTSQLHIACYNNWIKEIKVILQCYDVSINCCDKDGHFSLYWANQQGYVNVVKELFLHSAVVNNRNKKAASPLWIASQNGHDNVVTELIQNLAEVNKCSTNGTTPLQIACCNNRIDVMNVLLQCEDIDINLYGNDGRSALYWASKGHVNVVKELFIHSVEDNNCRGKFALPLWVASCGEHVKKLLQHSTEVNKCDDKGVSPLWISSYQGHVNVVTELLEHSAK
ncbi:unnamed protein product [Mytilus coruscus]|uniref:Uncharacterized protein n=1 Tax=Mytilus coruscus TaxID=42192 RepID=A0A6J8F0M1_MYTCO|nr:unnamed protein product [Mytilus coruscus]